MSARTQRHAKDTKRGSNGFSIKIAIVLSIVVAASWFGYAELKKYQIAKHSAACREFSRTKQWERIERPARAWLAWDPHAALPWVHLAEAAQEAGDKSLAAEYLDQIPDDDPVAPRVLLERTTLLFGPLNRPLEGVETCRRLLRIEPRAGEARRRLISYYAFSLQRQPMVHEIREAIRLECEAPEHYVYLVGVDWLSFSNGYDVNQQWLQAEPDKELFLVARAIHRINTRDTAQSSPESGAEVLAAYEQVLADYLEQYPHNPELLVYFLDRSATSGDTGRVGELLDQATQESASDGRFWRFKGWLHATRNEFEDAEAAYRKCIELNRFDWVGRHYLAELFRQQGELDEVLLLEKLAVEGKEIQKELMQCPNASAVPAPLMQRVARYAIDCGEPAVGQTLLRRLAG